MGVVTLSPTGEEKQRLAQINHRQAGRRAPVLLPPAAGFFFGLQSISIAALFIESKKRWPAVGSKLDFLWPEYIY